MAKKRIEYKDLIKMVNDAILKDSDENIEKINKEAEHEYNEIQEEIRDSVRKRGFRSLFI